VVFIIPYEKILMHDVNQLFAEFKERAAGVICSDVPDRNNALVELEDVIARNADINEGERLRLRAYMQEYRRKLIDGYDAGANVPDLSDRKTGNSSPGDR
jgi:hypothetical protein